MVERSMVMFFILRWGKAQVEENNMLAREFQREKRN